MKNVKINKKQKLNWNYVLLDWNDLTVEEIAKKYKVSKSTIYNVLKKKNVSPLLGSSLRAKVNENYFSKIDTEDKAYFLGFLYADGCVEEKKSNTTIKYRVTLKLVEKDACIIEEFKKYLNFEGNINTTTRSKSAKAFWNCDKSLSIRSPKLGKDLIDKGCMVAKTHILKFPTKNQVPKHLQHHFIRGYFDGDGSVFISNEKHWRNKKVYPIIHSRFIGTSDMMNNITNILSLPNTVIKQPKSLKNSNIFTIEIKRNPRCKSLYKYLYKDSTIFLKRKKDIFDSYFNN